MIYLDDYIVHQEDHKSSRRLYRMSCDKCDKHRGYQRRSAHGMGMCRSCVSSHTHKNKVVSDETKAKMRRNNYLNNGGTSPWKGKKHSSTTKALLSKKATEQNKRYKGKHPYSGPNGCIKMRSSWEVKYAEYLDKNNIGWSYEPKSYKLNNGKLYTPDFILSDGTIVEIKGYFRNDAGEKWDMFLQGYPELNKSLLMKEELREMGVL